MILESDVAARLRPVFDAERLASDWRALAGEPLVAQRGPYHDGAWRGLALHAIDGDPRCLDAGSLGTRGFRPTSLIERTPHLRAALASLPSAKRAVRLMVLPPGAAIRAHVDAELNLAARIARLHVPIVTHDDVTLVIDGVACRWRPGELWFGDFTRPHHVENASDVTRVHLVMDVRLDAGLRALFPPGYLARVERAHAAALPRIRRLWRAWRAGAP